MNITIKRILLAALIIVLAAQFVFITVLPAVVNRKFQNGGVSALLKEKTGLNLNFDKAQITAYPDLSLKFEGANVSVTDSSQNEVLKTSDFDVTLRLLPLLFKDLSIKSFNAQDFNLNISRRADKNVYLGSYALNLKIDPDQDFHPDIDALTISDADITFDDVLIKQKTNLKIKSADFLYKKHKRLNLILDAGVFVNGKKQTDIAADIASALPLEKSLSKGRTKFFLQINSLNLSDFSNYLSYLMHQEVKSASGVLDIVVKSQGNALDTTLKLKNLNIQMQNPLDSIRSKSTLRAISVINFEPKNLVLEKAKVLTDDWTVEVSGKIKNYGSSNPQPDLHAEVKDSDINAMYWLVPTFKEDETFVIQKFKKYGAWGRANGAIDIKGSLKKPLLYGELNLTDVYIVKDNPVVPHCKIYTKLLGDKLYIKTRVFAGHGEYVDIEGTADMGLYAPGDFHVVSSKNVDLGTAEYMLVPIHEIVGFDVGPVPYMKIQGKGNIDLRTNGTVLEGFAYGQFNFRNTTATLQGLNTKLENAEGVLDFNGKDMHFYTKKAFVKNHPLKIDGKANLNGNIDFDVSSDSMELAELLNILRTSSILADKKAMASPVEKASGKVKTTIKIKGVVKDFGEVLKKNTLDISGTLQLSDSVGEIKYLPVAAHKLKGKIGFHNSGWNIDLNGLAGSAPIKIKGASTGEKTDLSLSAPALKTDELIKAFVDSQNKKIDRGSKKIPQLPATNSYMSLFARYCTKGTKGSPQQIDFEGISAKGSFSPYKSSAKNKKDNDFVISSGSFDVHNGKLTLKNFKAKLFNSQISADGHINNFFSKDYLITGKLKMHNFNISAFNSIKNMPVLPDYLQSLLNAYDNYQGYADADISCSNNNLDGKINLKNIKFNHSYFKTPVSVERGDILLEGTKITLHSIIAQIDDTPVFLNLSVRDLDKTMKLGGYFTTKLTEQFVNKYINTQLTYPVKPRGDITITTDISGNINNIRLKPKIKFAPGADVYYMGASLGDEQEPRELNADVTIKDGDVFYIHDFIYKRYITSQNNRKTQHPVFKVNGTVRQTHDGFYADGLNIHTINSANVKLFNILFKKSVLKNGMFNCKLNINGDFESPTILGTVNMKNLDMPLYDTVLKSIDAKFQGKSLYAKVTGETLGSDFKLDIIGANKLTRPYIIDRLELHSKHVNIDNFIDSLTKIPTPDTTARLVDSGSGSANISVILPSFNISDVQIKSGKMTADEIVISDLSATNYSSDFTLDENMILKADKIYFDVTTGQMMGTADYDFSNGKIKTNISALNVDSNKVASSLFGFKDQIFGSSNGNIAVTTHGASVEERLKNMFGYVYFEVADGKMPKLGSVEYLLKAGNVLKSGITGANLNNLLDLIAPIKTGHFDSIKGSFTLKNGIAQNMEIYSKGDNLNLYINGEYDVLENYANMRVFGRLTKRATNILGPIGNLSFNSLLNAIPGMKLGKDEKKGFITDLNKIPGVELDDEQYRIFTVKIDGKINENKFVKNFRWME